MGYMTNGLTFNTLRAANEERLPTFKNRLGLPAHTEPDGSDWSLAEWLQALIGEVGEYANLQKKIQRGDFATKDPAVVKRMVADELADIQTYLDLLAFRNGVDLGQAVTNKFNEVSERVGSPIYIDNDEWYLRETKK